MNAASSLGAHDHVFLGASHDRNQRRTMIVVGITALTMVVEIVAGYAYGSMALLADGFHMSTHAGALLIAALAYRYARRHAQDPAFTFGTGKIGDLAAFASAIVLGVIALLIAADALWRLAHPVTIDFKPAIVVAIIGLAVNLASAALLHDGHHHHHDLDQNHEHEHHDHTHGRDNNLRAAYLHVLADALTSILAIGALLAGLLLDLVWLDPAIGILGAVMIASWSLRLMRESGRVLVDTVPDGALRDAMRHRIEATGARITDLHLWRLGPGHNAAVISLTAPDPGTPDQYRSALAELHGLSHVTIEVHRVKAG